MTDRDNTHEDAIDGAAGVQGAEDPDGAAGADGTGEELDSEVAALLGASLRPVTPPAGIRSALLEAIAREPQLDPVAGAVIAASDGDAAEAGGAPSAGPAVDPDSAADRVAGADSAGSVRSADPLDSEDSAVVSLDARRRRRSAWRTGLVRAAAAVVLLGVGVGVGRWSARGAVDEAMDSMAPTQHYAHLNQAQDVQRVTDTMPDGHVATLTWSHDMSMTALTLPAAMKKTAGDRSLQVWLKEEDRTTSLGVYDPRGGAGFSFLDIMPKPGQQIVITLEPAGGSAQPTTPPLVILRVGEDDGQSGTTTGSPAPGPSPSPVGDSA